MLRIFTADAVEPLADRLVATLAEPLEDPMTPEWIAVPTAGMQRWLALRLARSLGASPEHSGDGVTANITFAFPGALRHNILSTGAADPKPDPWHVDHLVWAVLDVLRRSVGDDRLRLPTTLPDGTTWFGRARHIADLFDRYATRRPDLLAQWQLGHDVDATGRPLSDDHQWQPHLWRLVRARIGLPGPAERLPDLLQRLRNDPEVDNLHLPPRLAVFAMTALPGGSPFLAMVDALAVQRDVNLFFLDPSSAASSKLRAVTPRDAQTNSHRPAVGDVTDPVTHPLLRSWGRPSSERTVLLTAAEAIGVPRPCPLDRHRPATTAERTPTLLEQIQHDLRSDHAPAGILEPRYDDQSITVHSCHGPSRQVEVLRDAILHLLVDDPSLCEEDIVVVCPHISRFAPLIEAGFGPPTEQSGVPPSTTTPRLRYHITDRSLRQAYPALSAFANLLDLVSDRCTATAVLRFMSLAPVRRRFGFDDDDLIMIGDWVAEAGVRWGLNATHRAQWGLPTALTTNSWQAAVDRILMGVAVDDTTVALGPDGIAPLHAEGAHVAVAGRLADFVTRLTAVTENLRHSRSPAQWSSVLGAVADQFLAVESSQQWQLRHLHTVLAAIGEDAVIGKEPATTELSLADIRRLLADQLQGTPPYPGYFAGGIAVCSPVPLRGIPFRVVCILGLDDSPSGSGHDPVDGDDLAGQAPLLGDQDIRSESREALLFAVLTARDHLVITRTGHDVRTNRPVPPAVAFAELRDTIAATLTPAARLERWPQIETVHPRQAFDERCFRPGILGRSGPWSFDVAAQAGARARAERISAQRRIVPARAADPPSVATSPHGPSPAAAATPAGNGAEPLHQARPDPVIALRDLQSFLVHPVRAYLRNRLGLHLVEHDQLPNDDLPIVPDKLQIWSAGTRLIEARMAGYTNAQWEQHELALGTLPPGGFGTNLAREVTAAVDAVTARSFEAGIEPNRHDRFAVDVAVPNGARIVGVLDGRCRPPAPGPGTVTYSRLAPRHHLIAWLQLLVLVASDPACNWQSIVVGRSAEPTTAAVVRLGASGATSEERRSSALAGLAVATDCFLRGQIEPLPLFPNLSPLLFDETATATHWQGHKNSGDGNDEANRLAFGDLDWHGLLAIPARDDDPPGPAAGRAHRYARYLWGTVYATATSDP